MSFPPILLKLRNGHEFCPCSIHRAPSHFNPSSHRFRPAKYLRSYPPPITCRTLAKSFSQASWEYLLPTHKSFNSVLIYLPSSDKRGVVDSMMFLPTFAKA